MKKAMVYGAGISGFGAKNLLEKRGYEVILVDDRSGLSSKEAIDYLDEVELLIKSPGIPYTELILKAMDKGVEVIGDIELSYRVLKEANKLPKIIAITGTNGKTTVTTKIKELLSFAGMKAEYAGNVGRSIGEVTIELLVGRELQYIVLEMSSYQLENIKDFKPDIAMIINLAPDHLDRYRDAEHYYDTKFRITLNQDEDNTFIVNRDCGEVVKRLDLVKSKKASVSRKLLNTNIYILDGWLMKEGKRLLDTSKLSLKGEHNLENQLFIVETALLEGISIEIIREFLYSTGSLEHRMEEFYRFKDIKFINDSKGTNLDSTLMAIRSFNKPIVILGGADKKLDMKEFVGALKGNIKEAYLIGEIADILEDLMIEEGFSKDTIKNVATLEKAIASIREDIDMNGNETILLSPATASFDQFKNYIERGNRFKELVKLHFREEK